MYRLRRLSGGAMRVHLADKTELSDRSAGQDDRNAPHAVDRRCADGDFFGGTRLRNADGAPVGMTTRLDAGQNFVGRFFSSQHRK
jgi:hypothetical protein